MLELKNIVKVYESGDTQVKALDGVDLCFRESEFVSILGPSGCGKTTILNITEAIITGMLFKLFEYKFQKISCFYQGKDKR